MVVYKSDVLFPLFLPPDHGVLSADHVQEILSQPWAGKQLVVTGEHKVGVGSLAGNVPGNVDRVGQVVGRLVGPLTGQLLQVQTRGNISA